MLLFGAEIPDESGERQGRPVDSGGDEAPEDGLCEGGVGSPGEEPEELYQQVLVKIRALGVFLILLCHSPSLVQVYSLHPKIRVENQADREQY